MIKTFVVSTAIVDDAEAAVSEILSQLDLEKGLLANSAGIISCHYEFIESGIVEAVCAALPFDLAGTISWMLSVKDNTDTFLMTIMVLTSDDVEFVNVLTPPLHEAPGQTISDSYAAAAAARDDTPGLIFAFAPFMPLNSGDEYVDVITKVSGGVPCFGTLAIDDTPDFANCFMLHNGRHYSDRMAMILVYGDISPKFVVTSMSEEKALDKSAIITKSAGHIIKEVNGRPIAEFFEDLGLTKASESYGAMVSLPFLLDYNDGTPKVSKICVTLTPERYALCAGAVPEGSTLQIAPSDKRDVMLTAQNAVDRILQNIQGASCLLVYSCVARSMTLGGDQFDEMYLVNKHTGGKLPYMMMYSGGEICPTQVEGGVATNRFHNNAFIACLL
ncbi:MAG: FIST C-terminal domain-containing protein [Clostridiales bacterium]|jgi:hypothetical protein|nr:FIST C-terminal domain-containing protein [Clostridiales bacterium]